MSQFPRLANATPEQRGKFELLGDGEGIHWPEVDEDLSVAGLLPLSQLVARDFRMSLAATILLALVLAISGFLSIRVPHERPVSRRVGVGVLLRLARYGLRGWPVLLGVPFCIPVFWIFWILANCGSHGGCP